MRFPAIRHRWPPGANSSRLGRMQNRCHRHNFALGGWKRRPAQYQEPSHAGLRPHLAHRASRPNWKAAGRSLEQLKGNDKAGIIANCYDCAKT
jgi:hypothetical protein